MATTMAARARATTDEGAATRMRLVEPTEEGAGAALAAVRVRVRLVAPSEEGAETRRQDGARDVELRAAPETPACVLLAALRARLEFEDPAAAARADWDSARLLADGEPLAADAPLPNFVGALVCEARARDHVGAPTPAWLVGPGLAPESAPAPEPEPGSGPRSDAESWAATAAVIDAERAARERAAEEARARVELLSAARARQESIRAQEERPAAEGAPAAGLASAVTDLDDNTDTEPARGRGCEPAPVAGLFAPFSRFGACNWAYRQRAPEVSMDDVLRSLSRGAAGKRYCFGDARDAPEPARPRIPPLPEIPVGDWQTPAAAPAPAAPESAPGPAPAPENAPAPGPVSGAGPGPRPASELRAIADAAVWRRCEELQRLFMVPAAASGWHGVTMRVHDDLEHEICPSVRTAEALRSLGYEVERSVEPGDSSVLVVRW